MAKKSIKSSTSNSQRDGLSPSLENLLTINIRPAPILIPVAPLNPIDIGDGRHYRPDTRYAPPLAVRRSAAMVKPYTSGPLHGMRFADPKLVALCMRRKTRREVIFAFNKSRKGASAPKRKNFWSRISCSPR